MASPLVIAKTPDGKNLALLPALANRHGLITGATGTGKTVTMQVIAGREGSMRRAVAQKRQRPHPQLQ